MVGLSRLPLVYVLVCLAFALLPSSAAQAASGPVDRAHGLLDMATAVIGQNDGIDSRLQKLDGRLNEIPPGAGEAAVTLPLLRRLARGADEALINERSIAADLDEAANLASDPVLGMYIGQQQAISRLRLRYWTLQQEKAVKLAALFGDWDQLSPAARSGSRAEYEGLAAKASELRVTIDEKRAASEKFYEMKGLGGVLPEGADQPPPEPPAWQGYLWMAFILALGAAAGTLAVVLGGRRLVSGAGRPARPTALGWCVLAFGLAPPLLMFLVGRAGSGLLPWIWAAGLAVLIAGVGALVRRDRHWPTWAGLASGVPVSLFWALFALGHVAGWAE